MPSMLDSPIRTSRRIQFHSLSSLQNCFALYFALALGIVFGSSPAAQAQQFATVQVTVVDPSGSVVPEARLSILNADTGLTRTKLSDRLGQAEIPGLPAGRYTLSVEAPSFSRYQASLSLSLEQVATVQVALGVGATTERVEVQGTTEEVDRERSVTSQVIDPHQIADLPIAGRDFVDFVLLTPTATVGRNFSTGAQSAFQETVLQVSFGGLRETHSVFYGLDGTDYTTSVSGVQRVSPSLDWVQEFRVVDGPNASDGLNLGGSVNTVTKSGTNDLHASVYEYFQNNALNANNLLAAPGFNTLRFNQFGANAGGPVQTDKLFYFAGYEGQRRAQSPLYSHFILKCIDTEGCLGPGTLSINEVKSSLGLSPENLGSILQTGNYDDFFGKASEVLSDRTTLAVGYLFTDVTNGNTAAASPGQGLPSSYRNNQVHDQTLYANLFHLFSNPWSSESSLSFGRRTFTMNPVGAGYEPAINVADTLYSGGFLGGVSRYSEHRFQSREAVTYTRDSNSIKVGAEFEPVWFSAQTPYFTPGVGIFSPQSFFGAGPFASAPFGPGTAVEFIFQQPRSEFGQQVPQRALPFEQGFYTGPDAALREDADSVKFWHKLAGLYLQDQWRPRHDLALSLGLRYDLDFFPSAKDLRLLGKMSPTNLGNVQPRVGVAYSYRGGKGVVRSSFGLYTGSFEYSSTINDWHGASAFTQMNQPLLPTFANHDENLVGYGPAGMVGTIGPRFSSSAFSSFTHGGIYPDPSTLKQFPLGFIKRDFPNSCAEQASLEFENQLGRSWVLTTGYHYLHAIHLISSNTINGLPDGNLVDGRQKFQPADTNFGFALYATPSGWSIYNAATVSLRREMRDHYSILANYTYGKSIDVATENQLQDEPQDYLRPQLDRAVSDNDMRQRFVLTLLGESSQRWIAPLRNFQGLDAEYSAESAVLQHPGRVRRERGWVPLQ